jgi:outer membrane translocation and assembly module TamA
VRSIGPGAYVPNENTTSYLDQTGDIKFLANLEYRPRIFGNLYGAVFLDAGNVWTMHDEESRPGGQLKFNRLLKDMALGTGVGVRYDLDFFVIRVDWGIGLHVPYKSGFFNIGKFKDNQSIHLAIGYPF